MGLALLTLISKDLRLLFRDRLALTLIFLAPVLVISAAGVSLSTLYRSSGHLLPVSDLDSGPAAAKLLEALAEVPEIEIRKLSVEESKRLVSETPRAGAALFIPEGFSRAVQEGEPVTLVLWTDPVKHLEVLKIKAAVERARAGLVTARVAARIAVVQVLTYAGEADYEALAEDSAELASRLAPEAVGLEEESAFGGPTEYNTFDQNVPGFSVTFLLLGMLFGVGLGLLDEREWGMLYRLSAAPFPRSALIAGKMLSRFLIGCLQMVILFLFGWWAFGISLGPSLVGLGLAIVFVAFASSAFGFLASAVARSRDALLPLGTLAVMIMAAIGGCWWPISIEPLWLQRAAHVFPTAWAMGAFNDLMLRHRELGDILPKIAALAAFGVAYVVLGARFYPWRESA